MGEIKEIPQSVMNGAETVALMFFPESKELQKIARVVALSILAERKRCEAVCLDRSCGPVNEASARGESATNLPEVVVSLECADAIRDGE